MRGMGTDGEAERDALEMSGSKARKGRNGSGAIKEETHKGWDESVRGGKEVQQSGKRRR